MSHTIRNIILCAFFGMLFLSCREKLPFGVSDSTVRLTFRFVPADYFSFDNWKIDIYGNRIQSSYFRNSWTVGDTGKSILGWTRVAIVVDSTFQGSSQFVRRDSLYFRFTDEGDVYQYGFLKSLIAERETLNFAPRWDRIAAFSQALGESWQIMRIDTSMGARTNQTVYGTIIPTREYVGVTINGVQRAVLSYRIEITKPRLDYKFWLVDSPTAVAKVIDDSEALPNSTFRQLTTMKTRQ